MTMEHLDVIVIGMGPGGELVADGMLSQGRRVALIERELIGGECGYWACIPTKVLLRAVEARQGAADAPGTTRPDLDWPRLREHRDLMIRHLDDTKQVEGYRERGALVLRGTAEVVGRDPWRVKVGETELSADHVVVATGSSPVRPPVEGLDELGPDLVWTNREATTLTEVPGSAVVIGGSAVGIELGGFLAGMGTRVSIVQRGPRLLDREDPRLCALITERLESAGVDVRVDSQVERVRRDGDGVLSTLSDGSRVRSDVVVLATGRRPRGDELGLAEVGVQLDGSALPVDENCRVAPGLWAVGDVTARSMFTHVAKYQGRVVVDNILGRRNRADYTGVARVVFSDPEIAAVGLTEEQARQQGLDVTTAEVDLTEALARPWTYATDPVGHLGLVADRGQGVLVGAWAFGPMASEWIHTGALAIRMGLPVAALRDSIPQFPTFNEGYIEALNALRM